MNEWERRKEIEKVRSDPAFQSWLVCAIAYEFSIELFPESERTMENAPEDQDEPDVSALGHEEKHEWEMSTSFFGFICRNYKNAENLKKFCDTVLFIKFPEGEEMEILEEQAFEKYCQKPEGSPFFTKSIID